ncbi:hypothetical protein Tco_1245114 [Tanacetum coccineum]
MSRANPQAAIVSEEQLVPSANILIIKKNNQRVIVTFLSLSRDSLFLDIDEEKDDENDDSDNFDMDLFADEPQGDDDAAGFGVFMYNKSIEPLKSTYLSHTVTCSSLEYI